MKGKITDWTKSDLKKEILTRMNYVDVSEEEFNNTTLLKDFEDLCNKSKEVS